MKRLWAAAAAAVMGTAALTAGSAQAAPAPVYRAGKGVKINVMGEWAHPDDDTSIIGPCGVWHERYDTKCGIIMVTRGEGGGNGAGTEIGPALGLRRENEDRVAHYRSGTVDIFNLDRVDFFYNLSAPLTQYFWRQDETLRRITRIIRMTQPDVYIGFNPTIQGAGHGNHQQAGRYIWEGMQAAADPTMFPEQLTGPGALSTWQVKKVFSGGSTTGTGGNALAANCTTGFVPAATNNDTVNGVWLGYDSPYTWAEGNVQGKPAGSPKSWAQVAAEGRARLPDAEPHDDADGHRPELRALRADVRHRPLPAERQSRRQRQRARRPRRRDPLRRDRPGSRRPPAGHDRADHLLALLQHPRPAVRRDRPAEVRRRDDPRRRRRD